MANQTPGLRASATTGQIHPGPASGAHQSRRSTLSPVRRAYQAVVLVGYAVLGVAVPMVVDAIKEWRR